MEAGYWFKCYNNKRLCECTIRKNKMDIVFIKDLNARGIIGINDWEREKIQDILINVQMHTDINATALSDDITDSVDYKTVAKKIQIHAEKAKRFTVEALASDIADICLQEPKVQKVLVRVEKPGAVRFSRSVGVEIEREA